LLYDYIQQSAIEKKQLDAVIKELWRSATYEDYEPKLDEDWQPSPLPGV